MSIVDQKTLEITKQIDMKCAVSCIVFESVNKVIAVAQEKKISFFNSEKLELIKESDVRGVIHTIG